MTRPMIVMLHALGGSARSWDTVIPHLPGFDCLAIDLPGYGDAATDPELSVEAMVESVARTSARHAPDRWMLVGHSMGGKIATLLAKRAEHGDERLAGLAGIALLAASPPSPEPIDETRRARMIGWACEGPISERDARTFVDANVAASLPAELDSAAIADVCRASPEAWQAWLELGSREDWSAQVGVLSIPALICAGAEDGDLGEAAQRPLNLPHYARASFEIVPDAAHLLPLEQPERVAALIHAHWHRAVRTQP